MNSLEQIHPIMYDIDYFQYLLNHFDSNHLITTKSGLVKSLKYFYSHEGAPLSKHIFQAIPTSFIVHAHQESTEFKDFKQKFQQIQKKQFYNEKIPEKHCQKNIWFIKPQSNNQGKGIILANNWKDIQNFLISKPVNSGWIFQKAIQKPFLYNNRKFDVRVWVLVTPQFQVYYYNTPYMRTSSTLYVLDSLDTEIHLTNNCQQKYSSEYSKYEEGNTLPFLRLREYLLEKPEYADRADLIIDKIVSRMKDMIIDTMNCAKKHFRKNSRRNKFELFGYDFLIDQDFRTWILQVNNNPYIGVPNKFIKGLLPLMIDEMMEIIVDPFYPPQNYTPVAIKRFQLLSKQRSDFRVGSITSRNSTTNTVELRKNNGKSTFNFQQQKMHMYSTQKSKNSIKCSIYQKNLDRLGNIDKMENYQGVSVLKEKFRYITPHKNLKHLLEHYCYDDLDPFFTPVGLILNSEKLTEQSLLQTNLKNLALIVQTRIAGILMESNFFEICSKIILSKSYDEKIRGLIVKGYENAAKNFKGKVFVLQKVIPVLSDLLKRDIGEISDHLIQYIMKLQIKLGSYLQKVFIPGVTSQNQRLRKMFIKSNCFTLLLYLSRTYPHLCVQELKNFMMNFSREDWDSFYDLSKNKGKRAYSPRSVSILMKQKDSPFNLTLNQIKNYNQQKQVKFYQANISSNNKQDKSFRNRRHNVFPSIKK